MNIIVEWIQFFLQNAHLHIGDWGLSVVCITVLIKVVLLPLSLKQKSGIEAQQQMSEKIKAVQEKYKGQKELMEKETARITTEYSSQLLGCFLSLVQLPILLSLFRAVSGINLGAATTLLLPWVVDLTGPDPTYILPIIACSIQLLPSVLGYLKIFKPLNLPKLNKTTVIVMLVINGVFIGQAPVMVGIYWVVSGMFNVIEQTVCYCLKVKQHRRAAVQ